MFSAHTRGTTGCHTPTHGAMHDPWRLTSLLACRGPGAELGKKRRSAGVRPAAGQCRFGGLPDYRILPSPELRKLPPRPRWTHWGLNSGPEGRKAKIIPLHHVSVIRRRAGKLTLKGALWNSWISAFPHGQKSSREVGFITITEIVRLNDMAH